MHKENEIATEISIYNCKSLLDIVIFIGQGNGGPSCFHTEKKSALVMARKSYTKNPCKWGPKPEHQSDTKVGLTPSRYNSGTVAVL